MGGSSNQLVIYNGTNRSEKMQDSHFWSHSWLRYGAEMVRERLLKHIYDAHVAATSTVFTASTDDIPAESAASTGGVGNSTNSQVQYLRNPCANVDYYDVYTEDYVFVGTGHPQECVSLLERIIWSEEEDIDALRENILRSRAKLRDTATDTEILEAEAERVLEDSSATNDGIFEHVRAGTPGLSRCVQGPCPIDSIVHPSVSGHHFYAMSVYYYALDCVRALGPEPLPHW